MRRVSMWTLAVCCVVVLGSCAATGVGSGVITGTLTYRERIALLPSSTATVELHRMSGSTSELIATNSFAATGQVPVPFTLTYDPARINTSFGHVLRARIVNDQGATQFATQSDVPVTFDGVPMVVELVMVGSGTGTVGTQRR